MFLIQPATTADYEVPKRRDVVRPVSLKAVARIYCLYPRGGVYRGRRERWCLQLPTRHCTILLLGSRIHHVRRHSRHQFHGRLHHFHQCLHKRHRHHALADCAVLIPPKPCTPCRECRSVHCHTRCMRVLDCCKPRS